MPSSARMSLKCAFGQVRHVSRNFIHAVVLSAVLLFTYVSCAQTGTATLAGTITDTRGALMPGAKVTITNEETAMSVNASTNNAGIYNVPGLQPGKYRILIEKEGFKQVDVRDLTLNVQDVVSRNFTLEVGGTSETIQVDGNRVSINTTDAAVSTVIDRQFVENIPMNGRSFQTLVLLSPGTTTGTPQGTDNNGEFSVNGQRSDANNYLVDGVSANNGGAYGNSPAVAGMTGSTTALGTTQAILSVDALEEFRIATSTYSAEYGRQPGAQISFQSRSGTNTYHGTTFDYFRNYVLDANNWFNDYVTPALAKPAERQNDFGGVLGGPLSIPPAFSGKDRLFFFVSYEGLRLSQPIAPKIYYVPSNGTFNTATYSNPQYANLRANAPMALKPVLNGFPLPNCSMQVDPQCVDYGDGLSPFLVSGTGPSSIDALSGRLDAQIYPWLRLFARYSDTQSRTATNPGGGYGNLFKNTFRTRAYLLGADSTFRGSIVNQLRLQYSPFYELSSTTPTPLGGASPLDLPALHGVPEEGEFVFAYYAPSGEASRTAQYSLGTRQFQPNAVDTVAWNSGRHSFKAGLDYRQTTTYLGKGYLARSPVVLDEFESPDQILQNSLNESYVVKALRQDPTSKSLGLFFQDEWRVNHRLNLSLGLRWEFLPPPSVSGVKEYTYAGDLNNPSSLTLAPLGTPLYKTSYTEFAPRLGLALTLRDIPGHETVLRGGVGLFYDINQSFLSVAFGSGYDVGTGSTYLSGLIVNQPKSFPTAASVIEAPIPPVSAPYTMGFVPDRNLHAPSTIQWNVTLEQSLGQPQTVSVSYVGAVGMDLTHDKDFSSITNPLFTGTFVVTQNGPGSNYNALQVQYKRQLAHGLQALAAYTWAHAIDWDTSDIDTYLTSQRGSADHDVRNTFSSALVYNVPTQYPDGWQRNIFGYWNIDLRFTARSAFPVQVQGPELFDPVTGVGYASILSYSGGNPYVHVKGIPGGRQFDPAVFSVATASENGNGNAPRNFLRGFGETQLDLAIQRDFPLYEQMHLQFRAEAFNLPNHPNFGAINAICGTSTPGATCTNPLMGQATNTLSNALPGLASIYQQGGPRSLQLALKLQF